MRKIQQQNWASRVAILIHRMARKPTHWCCGDEKSCVRAELDEVGAEKRTSCARLARTIIMAQVLVVGDGDAQRMVSSSSPATIREAVWGARSTPPKRDSRFNSHVQLSSLAQLHHFSLSLAVFITEFSEKYSLFLGLVHKK